MIRPRRLRRSNSPRISAAGNGSPIPTTLALDAVSISNAAMPAHSRLEPLRQRAHTSDGADAVAFVSLGGGMT